MAVARLEQLYPFPKEEVAELIAAYPNVSEVVWLQEEPRNMGAWSYVALRFTDVLRAGGVRLRYIGRPPRANRINASAAA